MKKSIPIIYPQTDTFHYTVDSWGNKKNEFHKFLGSCSFTDIVAPMLESSHILCNIKTIPMHDKDKLMQCNDVP